MPTKKTTPALKNGRGTKRKSVRRPTPVRKLDQLEAEIHRLREENRQLKRSLGTLMCKDEPKNMDLTPEDGVCEPPLDELIRGLERKRK